jgi:hypothetical protein
MQARATTKRWAARVASTLVLVGIATGAAFGVSTTGGQGETAVATAATTHQSTGPRGTLVATARSGGEVASSQIRPPLSPQLPMTSPHARPGAAPLRQTRRTAGP